MSVACKRCGREAEGPPPHRVPFTGQAKDDVLSGICGACWKEWEGMEVKVINEYRLNLADPDHYSVLIEQMRSFLGLGPGAVLEVENPERGKGQPS